jgi:hypothetical protein
MRTRGLTHDSDVLRITYVKMRPDQATPTIRIKLSWQWVETQASSRMRVAWVTSVEFDVLEHPSDRTLNILRHLVAVALRSDGGAQENVSTTEEDGL